MDFWLGIGVIVVVLATVTVWLMDRRSRTYPTKSIVLAAVASLNSEGVTPTGHQIGQRVEAMTGQQISFGALYLSLSDLEDERAITSREIPHLPRDKDDPPKRFVYRVADRFRDQASAQAADGPRAGQRGEG